MKRILLAVATAITLLSSTTTYAGILTMPAKVVTKTPTFALTLTGLDLAALAVIPLSKYFDMASHDPDGAQAYLSKHPVQRNVIRMKTFKALRKAESREDYQRIHDSAVDYLGFSGLPGYEGTDLDTSNPGYESDRMDHAPMINPIRDARPDDIILVNPITKIKINVTMEYPTEDIRNWKDYLIFTQDSTTLGKNLITAGEKKPLGSAAHHIVPAGAPGSAKARKILQKYGININSAINGVFLPGRLFIDFDVKNAIIHNGPHPSEYIRAVNDRILQADANGGEQAVINELKDMKKSLLSGNGKTWRNVL